MAFYLQIKKIGETNRVAIYEFSSSPEDGKFGQLRIHKSSGDIEEIQPHPLDEAKKLYARAARKVFLHHQNGDYPEITCWAS